MRAVSKTQNPIVLPALIFCDGACSGNPGPGGWAFIGWDPKSNAVIESHGHVPQTTNNRMELQAALESMLWLEKLGLHSARIHTDSKYVISGMESWIKSWKMRGWRKADGEAVLNMDLWKNLDEQVKALNHQALPCQIEWAYVPGHSGVAGNERVDELAVLASKTPGLLNSTHLTLENYTNQDIFLSSTQAKTQIQKKTGASSKKTSKALGYVALLDGQLKEFTHWKECETFVKGRSGAKFKKFSSIQERLDILRDWKIN